jgi:hypothetical protein
MYERPPTFCLQIQYIQCIYDQATDLDTITCHDVLNQAAEFYRNCGFQNKTVYAVVQKQGEYV